jgi:uncharacterized protein YbjT (DUF2867 family)
MDGGDNMIVITTPTGKIGQQVLEKLMDSGETIRVIARDPSRLPARAHERVEVVEGSHSDSGVVDRAFEGAGSVFWVVPPDFQANNVEKRYLEFIRPACEAFKRRGVKRVVAVSALGRGWPKPAGLVSASVAMDDLIASTGVSLRALTMPSFMDNFLRQVEPIKNQGVFFSPMSGDLKAPTCATRDIAAVATKLLLESSWSGSGNVPVLGPEDLSCNEMAQIISEVLGRPVRFQQIPFEAFKTSLIESGASESMATGMVDMMVAKSEGLDNMEPRTAESTTPTSFRQWCDEVLKPAVLR